MKFISLFAGIGGFDLGLERAGMECVAQVEINPFCQQVLTKHWPNVPKYGDIRNVGKHNLPSADLICGGFPCQDVSEAGSQRGIKQETRSGLFYETIRIVCELRPRWVLIENVRGLLSSNDGADFRAVLWELSRIGYDAEWQTIQAASFGFPHKRKRIFILAYPSGIRWDVLHNQAPPVLKPGSIQDIVKSGHRWERKDGGHSPKSVGWSVTPELPGSYDGISAELDTTKSRLTSLGNAVVPQVVEHIGHMIMEARP